MRPSVPPPLPPPPPPPPRPSLLPHGWERSTHRGLGPGAEILGRDLRGKRLLELGCGSGHNVAHLAQHHWARVTGIDLVGLQVRRARSHYEHIEGATFAVGHALLLQHVEQLIETTPYPDRASAPEDEPLIEQLLTAGGGRRASEYTMAPILLNADRAPSADQPPKLRPVANKEPPMPQISADAAAAAEAEAATARFMRGLPSAREVATTGELAAILAKLPADTPLFLEDHLVAHPGPVDDPVEVVVAHLTACAEPVDPDDLSSEHRMRPAPGLATIVVGHGQDAGAEFERDGVQPYDQLARAEERLGSTGDLDGGIRDVADVIDTVAALLAEGAKFIPSGHDAHATVTVEASRLRHAADRLRNTASQAQQASE
ncbi:SAM-dependent methyltransferase [Streptomyces mirabilis]|uniref:SAM-dependent methyltransferase n=1 Tax=Streptomyces mirabilis TaxID=68239 RepID=UPI0036D84351